ncbi:MAG: hypothetical protein ACK4HE_04565 [Chitinophagaceae bacterium]
MIPYSYETWKYCIEVDCNITLTKNFIEERIQALSDTSLKATQEFIAKYGETHHLQTITWFMQALQNTR